MPVTNQPRTAFCPSCMETVRVRRGKLFGARFDACEKCGEMLDRRDMTPGEKLPKCPWCHSDQCVHTSNANLKAFYCRQCKREFEPGDDGDITYGDPSKRLEREERRRENRRPGRW